MVHSKIGASQAARWMECPASVQQSEGQPSTSSVWANEGTAAHSVAEICLGKQKLAVSMVGQVIRVGEAEFEVTEEMAEAVQVYLDAVWADADRLGGAKLLIEHKFHLKSIHKDLFGTNDACLSEPFGKLIVYDYKHGAGKPVEVERNPQLMIYALGALADNLSAETVELVIVQPRAKHKDGSVRRWEISPDELTLWGETELTKAIKATEAKKPTFKVGKWCDWCKGMVTCPALRGKMIEELCADEVDTAPVVPKKGFPAVDTLTPSQIANLLEFKPLAEKYLASVYERAKEDLLAGKAIPGHKVVEGRANRKWVEDFNEKSGWLFQIMKADMYETKVKSPAQMEKALKEMGLPPKSIEPLVTVSRGLVVVSEFDKRDAYQSADVFDDNYEF